MRDSAELDGRQAGGIQQAGEGRALKLAQCFFERIPGGIGVAAVAAVAVGERPGPEVGGRQDDGLVDWLIAFAGRAAGGHNHRFSRQRGGLLFGKTHGQRVRGRPAAQESRYGRAPKLSVIVGRLVL